MVSLLFASYLVSSESGPGKWGTVSLAHRPREGRLGAKSDTCVSIFSICQPESHLPLLPFSSAATVCAAVICVGPELPGPRVPAGPWQACPGAELLKSQAREGGGEAVGSSAPRATRKARGLVCPGRSTRLAAPTTPAGSSCRFWSLPEGNCSRACGYSSERGLWSGQMLC